jgi:hypothetical protein
MNAMGYLLSFMNLLIWWRFGELRCEARTNCGVDLCLKACMIPRALFLGEMRNISPVSFEL